MVHIDTLNKPWRKARLAQPRLAVAGLHAPSHVPMLGSVCEK